MEDQPYAALTVMGEKLILHGVYEVIPLKLYLKNA